MQADVFGTGDLLIRRLLDEGSLLHCLVWVRYAGVTGPGLMMLSLIPMCAYVSHVYNGWFFCAFIHALSAPRAVPSVPRSVAIFSEPASSLTLSPLQRVQGFHHPVRQFSPLITGGVKRGKREETRGIWIVYSEAYRSRLVGRCLYFGSFGTCSRGGIRGVMVASNSAWWPTHGHRPQGDRR